MSALLQNLAREFAAIDDYLKAVGDIPRRGHMPDLSGLDKRVSDLCLQLQKADPDIQQQFIVKMNNLLSKLDICEQEIRAFHETQLKGMAGHD